MKRIFIFSLLFPLMLAGFSQGSSKKIKAYYIFINDTSFVTAMPEQGATFKAYFQDNALYKIETWFGFNFGDVSREYFYWNDTITLINETQKLYSATAVPKIDPDTIKSHYTGRYIFKNGKLSDIAQKGSYSISDTPSSKDETEVTFLMLSDKYRKIAYEKAKKKKNRIRITP
ncbi:MAG: hypothetical protein ACHQFW_01790 [Chitinophagales bacterium]